MMAKGAIPVEEARNSRVEFVADDGVVVLLLPDGQRRMTTIPPKSVQLVRRLAALNRDVE